jgi:hypothetical protein
MNLIEARKQAHEGWVRSPTRTGGIYIQFDATGFLSIGGGKGCAITAADLDADNWEPRPKPVKVWERWEREIWVRGEHVYVVRASESDEDWDGWRKIRVREVTE